MFFSRSPNRALVHSSRIAILTWHSDGCAPMARFGVLAAGQNVAKGFPFATADVAHLLPFVVK